MKRYKNMTFDEIMDAMNKPHTLPDNVCNGCVVFDWDIDHKGHSRCTKEKGTCSDIIRRFLNEEVEFKETEKMRDKNRIQRIMKLLTEIWEIVPDWRFGQLLSNMLGEISVKEGIRDIFFPEDDKWEKYLTEYKEQIL